MTTLRTLLLAFFATCTLASAADFLPGVRRIVFVGDSITYAGFYVDQFEAFLAAAYPDRDFEVINVGLPSETVSGLSEPGHAGGKFPRPDLHERLDRVLAKTKPDLVIACYGMNDGIYMPLSEERFAKYREGIEWLRGKVKAAGAPIIHMTPPVFDPGPGQTGYDDVLAKYSDWLMSKRSAGWRVIDLHTEMRRILDERRTKEPSFTFAKDKIHPNEEGHWIFSTVLVRDLTGNDRSAMALFNKLRATEHQTNLMKLIHQRGRILCDAWLTDTGHQRPGMAKGMPLDQAKTKAAGLSAEIKKAAAAAR